MAVERSPRRLPWALLLSGALHVALALTLAPRASAQTEPPPPPPDLWADNTVELSSEGPSDVSEPAPAPAAAAAPAVAEPAAPEEPAVPAPRPPEVRKKPVDPPAPRPAPRPAPKDKDEDPALAREREQEQKAERERRREEERARKQAQEDRRREQQEQARHEREQARLERDRALRDARHAVRPPQPAAPREPSRAAPGAAGEAAASSSAGASAAPVGQAGPVTVRDLGLAFTRALAPAGQPDKGWAALPVGAAGSLELALDIDAEGKIRGFNPLSKDPPEHLLRLVRQSLALLRSGFFAIRGPDPSAGRQVIRLSAVLSDVPKDVDGGPVALSHEYAGGRGKASFTQASGRRVNVTVELVRVEAAR